MTETNHNALILPDPNTETNALDQLRDIKPPVDIPNDWAWLIWVLTGLALGALAFWLWRYWQNRRLPKQAAVIVILPHVRARDRLREAMQWITDPERFCVKVSDAIRIYLAERFELHAPDRTTEEFLVELKSSDVLTAEQKIVLGQFLETCDLVKFARFEPSQTELESMHSLAHRLIDETEPLALTPSEKADIAPQAANESTAQTVEKHEG